MLTEIRLLEINNIHCHKESEGNENLTHMPWFDSKGPQGIFPANHRTLSNQGTDNTSFCHEPGDLK